jgi:transcriptional regulator with XRE-family HTH domain
MDVDALIGWNFRRLRQELGLSQDELWLRLGTLDQSYMSHLENGELNPTSRTIFRLAGALGVSEGELFQREGVPDAILFSSKTEVKKTRSGRKQKPNKKQKTP